MREKDKETCGFDLCKGCGWYEQTADYCVKGLFELDEKYGKRFPTEECFESRETPEELYKEIIGMWTKITEANNFYDTKKQGEKIEDIQESFNSLNIYLNDFYEIIQQRIILSEEEQKEYFGRINKISEGVLLPFDLHFTNEYLINNLKRIVRDLNPEITKMRRILKLV
ncbi:MAG: hypothetical protein KAT28_02580 [Candidatus Aenigmarchaeota archaeon]|nr:hypothetical protein [Candidatus Aenigmarchaeota archaeon]